MEEEVKNKKDNVNNRFMWTLVFVTVITFYIAGVATYQRFLLSRNLSGALQDLINCQETMKGKDVRLAACDEELKKLREHMEGIKNNADLLKRDIFLYIDKKFQLIPRTLAIDIAEQILVLSKKHDVSPELIVGIIQVESGFNPMAISSKNARGLMQVMPEWAPKFGLKKVTDLHDVDTGIECGIKVLKIHIEEDAKGNITKGLYYYVGKSDAYAGKVYSAMGKFVAFRSTIDDDEVDVSLNGDHHDDKEKEETDDSESESGAKESN